jgi:hypothetical protein
MRSDVWRSDRVEHDRPVLLAGHANDQGLSLLGQEFSSNRNTSIQNCDGLDFPFRDPARSKPCFRSTHRGCEVILMKRVALASTAVLAALAFLPSSADARGFGGGGFHGGGFHGGGFRGGGFGGGFRGAGFRGGYGGFRGGYGRYGYGRGYGYGGLGLGLGLATGAALGYGLSGGYGYPYGYGYGYGGPYYGGYAPVGYYGGPYGYYRRPYGYGYYGY